MPKRTNDFQELVGLIQKVYAPVGAKVTESALVNAEGREIDVLIESEVGPYHIKIAVEAKDHNRKMDSTQFESLMGKYLVDGGVKVSKIVVVTRGGFYKPVIERAKKLGVDLLTLSEAKAVDWMKFRPAIVPFKTTPRICDVEIDPPVPNAPIEKVVREGRVSCSHGTQLGTVQQFANRLFRQAIAQHDQGELRKFDSAAELAPEGKKLNLKWTADHPHQIRFAEIDSPLERLSFNVHFSKPAAPALVRPEVHFQLPAHVCRITTNPEIDGVEVNELRSEGHLVCLCCGRDHGSLNHWANKTAKGYLQKSPDIERQFKEGVEKSPHGQAWLTLNWNVDPKKVVRCRGKDYVVSQIGIVIHAVSAKAPLECKQYELKATDGEEKVLTHLEGTAGGKKFSLVIPHGDVGVPSNAVLRIDNAKPSERDPST